MQIKTIEKNIKAKLEEWLKTITDPGLADAVKKNLLVSGGSITSMLLNEPVNDYDIYLMDINVCKKLAQYYTKDFKDIEIFDGREKAVLVNNYNTTCPEKEGVLPIDQNNRFAISLRNLKENQIKLFFNTDNGGMRVNEDIEADKLNYTPLYFSPNAISLSNNLQIVLRFWGTPEEIHKTFDFIHATNYFTFEHGLVKNLAAFESILTKQLKYQGSLYPLTSIIRTKKFIKRGFNIGAGELLKIMFQISELDLKNPDVLEEQLIGVDVAYFDRLITILRGKLVSDNMFVISGSYLNTLIDKIFDSSDSID